MRTRIVTLAVLLVLAAGAASAQQALPAAKTPNPSDIYCSGMVTNETISYDTYLISGEESTYKIGFSSNDYVYINKGSSQGVKVGDQFQVMRPIKDTVKYRWFTYQTNLRLAMGRQWTDAGRIKVVVVHPEVSIAEIAQSCGPLQRGDHVLPFTERPAPPLKTAKFEPFAPVSGRPTAMVVSARNYESAIVGQHDVVYVNLGSAQGAKVGDYFRFFRYQGTLHESAYQVRGHQNRAYGYGATPPPRAWHWDNLPREVLGEGIVLRVSENAATVLITYSRREIYLGDYVEIE